jgi:hypothetical protein
MAKMLSAISFWKILFKSIMFTLVQSLNYMLTCLSLQGISNYEQLRLKNLQDNADFFAKLGIAKVRSYVYTISTSIY